MTREDLLKELDDYPTLQLAYGQHGEAFFAELSDLVSEAESAAAQEARDDAECDMEAGRG